MSAAAAASAGLPRAMALKQLVLVRVTGDVTLMPHANVYQMPILIEAKIPIELSYAGDHSWHGHGTAQHSRCQNGA
jgi:hypothetical protein